MDNMMPEWNQNALILRKEGGQMDWFKYAYLSYCTTSRKSKITQKVAISSLDMPRDDTEGS